MKVGMMVLYIMLIIKNPLATSVSVSDPGWRPFSKWPSKKKKRKEKFV
jgi:hypothetical protein